MIAVFFPKTGNLMFVGFDSQNTSTLFCTMLIGSCGFEALLCLGSEVNQRIRCGELSFTFIKDLAEMLLFVGDDKVFFDLLELCPALIFIANL